MSMRTRLACVTLALILSACEQTDDLNRVVGEMASDRIELTAEVKRADRRNPRQRRRFGHEGTTTTAPG